MQDAYIVFAQPLRAGAGEAAFGGEVEHLAADHAAQSGRARQRADQFDADAGIRMGLAARQDVESEGQQPVAGEDRGRFVEFLVRGRLSAPQIVVVHGGQIVMDQRIAMDAFERGAGHQRLLAWDIEQRGAFSHQERAEPFAAAEAGIAHGFDQPRRPAHFAGRYGRR